MEEPTPHEGLLPFESDFSLTINDEDVDRGMSSSKSNLLLLSLWLQRLFPISIWLRRYKLNMLLSDLVAGLTIGLMVIPQGLAYARVATLPPQYGLYSAYVGAFVYCVFGTAKDITLGPTAIVSLLIGQAVQSAGTVAEKVCWALTLSMMVGGGQIILGFLGLGILVDFISRPVISGFVSSSSLVIASEQLCHLFSTKCSNGNIISVFQNTFTNFGPSIKNHWPDLVIGLTSALLCVTLQKVGQRWGHRRILWILSTGRFFVVVSMDILLSYLLYVEGVHFGEHPPSSCQTGGAYFPCSPFTLLGHVQGGISGAIGIPAVTFNVIQEIGSFLPIVALVSYLESISIAQAFARKNGYRVDPNQELIAIGMANLTGSIFGAFPVTGSFSRSAVLASSGVKTPLAGIFTGVVVILALEVLSGVFFWIPSAGLAGIIISAVIPMFEANVFLRLWNTNRLELFVLLVSFFGCIFLGVALGIFIAAIISMLLSFYLGGHPGEKIIQQTTDRIVWRYEGPLHFYAARNFAELFVRRVEEYKRPNVVVDMSYITFMDDSGLCALEEACGILFKKNYKIHFLNARDNVFTSLVTSGLMKEGKEIDLEDV